MNEIKLFSPATVANVSCGFDVLGFCLDSIGDEMVIRKTVEKGIRITKIEGYELPFEIEKNVAGVSALAMYDAAKPDCGFEIEIYKHIKPGSGVGSSSASAVGSVYGMNVLLGNPYSKTELTAFAMKGEAVASQSEHADNIAPALFGGFTLVKSLEPLEVLQIPTPSDLFAVVIHPQIEIKTADARKILPEHISLKNAITQWSNVGSLIHGLHTNDYDLISRSLKDVVVEPFRSQLIPGFESIKKAALENGALGTGISGSGPSVFSLCKSEATAEKVEKAIRQTYQNQHIPFEIYVSKINLDGIKLLNEN
ncbi:homoserine kinase [Flavobacteriaceae bacterium]|nr:homoserine kinase [Flavobacteriaceae bacterium]MDA9970518.1 homoserine kinase [Flavobacteriaceae bacterium]MDB4289751.1 homoserine kinase [Flavobacteriaceae bacterium]MDB9954296.1 homoserine kinase [Flavobacteriaceae bacterium]MDC1265752.1 homoserine kinase [Flavobacteriaceae bacterium]